MFQKVKNRLKGQKGFTLIELLAVIVILGIIAAIAIPSINGIIQKSRVDAVHSEAAAVLNAAKLYSAENSVTEDITLINTPEAGLAEGQYTLDNYLDNPETYSITIDYVSDRVINYTNISVTKNDITLEYATGDDVQAKKASE